jgi:hypothetical protein
MTKQAEEFDANGDVIFRFKLDLDADGADVPLVEFYRQSIRDLLRVVRLYSGGKPVIVDAFAFLNQSAEQIPILNPR